MRKTKTETSGKERFFSVELKSKASLNNVTLADNGPENVLVEGTIGHLKRAEFAENAVLIVTGDRGVLAPGISYDFTWRGVLWIFALGVGYSKRLFDYLTNSKTNETSMTVSNSQPSRGGEKR